MAEIDIAREIQDVPLADALSERYLAYALSTIMARSLPDVRDGLKPVHRRLLYAMRGLKLASNKPPRKSARVVGDVIGKYHPHGDQSIYDALVRLAQDFSSRYPLAEGQGNFGNIDGDNPAAMRYTEAKMTLFAEAMLDGLDEDAVDFTPTYDADSNEPMVLPAAVPNLLANGATGIAVGMATSIPPHNLDELCQAAIHLIKTPDARDDTLLKFVKGPDFPTGGVLVESADSIRESYLTGRGSFRMRARWEVEKLPQGQWQIVVTEIPYQVQKGKLVEKIADLLIAKKLPLLGDVRDESTEDIRLVLVPKSRNVEAEVLMESLFKFSDLESRFSMNLNVLDANHVPRVMSLKEVLLAWTQHRKEVLLRRTRHRLDKIAHRLEVLEGHLVAFLNLDEVIRIIREEDEPKQELQKKFNLTETQAEAILNMRLRNLRKLEEMEIRREHKDLSAEQTDLKDLLADPARQNTALIDQIRQTRKDFGNGTELGARRTEIGDVPAEIEVPTEAMVEREPVTIICSDKGWIRAMKGHMTDLDQVKYKEGDRAGFSLHAQTTDKLLLLGTNGRFYTLPVDKLPGGRGFGEPVRLMIDLPQEADLVRLMVYEPGVELLLASSAGRGFRIKSDDVVAQTKSGKQILNVPAGEEAVACIPVAGDMVAVIGTHRKLLVFALDEIPQMSRGRGVILQKYKDAELSDIKVFTKEDGLTWQLGERVRSEEDMTPWLGKRAQVGRLPPVGFPRQNKFGD